MVEQIKNGAGEQSTYFLSPISNNKVLSTLKRDNSTDYTLNPPGTLSKRISSNKIETMLYKNCFCFDLDENVIGLSLQEILPDNNIKTEKMLVSNPPNILKRAKSIKMENAVSKYYYFIKCKLIFV